MLTPFVADPDFALYVGDALETLRELPDESVHCCVTSPPYWGLRDYGTDGQLGLEQTPEAYVAAMVAVFAEVRRVLRADGTLWLNIGDTFHGAAPVRSSGSENFTTETALARGSGGNVRSKARIGHIKVKDLVGIPWRLAFALQADGWYLRSDIIWSKPNPMPESVTDRPTKAHEYVFLLSKRPRYFFDQEAVREPSQDPADDLRRVRGDMNGYSRKHSQGGTSAFQTRDIDSVAARIASGRNVRSVWEIATQPYPEAHFAVFPAALVEPCILAGSPSDGTVLDPFMGSGTTALVARRLGRRSIGIELNPAYAELAAKRLSQLSLLAEEIA